jgi:hypothetical protein
MAYTELFYTRLEKSYVQNIRGEKLWLACMIDRPVEEVKKKITDLLSTMIIVYSLFCVFSISDINTPIVTDNYVIRTFFLVNASIETYMMLTLLSSSSAVYLYIILLPNDMDSAVEFIQQYNYWFSWFPLYGMLFCNILQITNIIFRLYTINPVLVISQSVVGLFFIVVGLAYILRISVYVHGKFNEKIKTCLLTR